MPYGEVEEKCYRDESVPTSQAVPWKWTLNKAKGDNLEMDPKYKAEISRTEEGPIAHRLGSNKTVNS
ncbi:hypothetical protein SLA2020_327270 [Shorea laevis]